MNESLQPPDDRPSPDQGSLGDAVSESLDPQMSGTPSSESVEVEKHPEVTSASPESSDLPETTVVSEDAAESFSSGGDVVEAGSEEGDDGEEEQAPVWIPEPDKLLLSLLFASHEYLDARSLREIMGPEWDTPRLRQLVKKLNRDLEGGELPFEITETEGTWRLRTLSKYFPWTRKLFKDSVPRRLSQAALETLAIVAYKQPVTKAEIESIRGVNVDGSMKTLLDKRLIDIGRRSDALGQAFTYHTTRDFMRYFGISRVPDDLPRLSEFEGILNAQSLIPQMGIDGEIHEVSRDDESENGTQLTLGMDGEPEN